MAFLKVLSVLCLISFHLNPTLSESHDGGQGEEVDSNELEMEEDVLFQRGAVFGHDTLAAGSERYKRPPIQPPLPPFFQPTPSHQPPAHPDLYQPPSHQPPPFLPNPGYGNNNPQVDLIKAAEAADFLLFTISNIISSNDDSCYGGGGYKPEPEKTCDANDWKACTCIFPATFSDDGRGNCNLGASKSDTKVWCYVDPKLGDPTVVCPDAKKSTSKPGYYWSRFACIT